MGWCLILLEVQANVLPVFFSAKNQRIFQENGFSIARHTSCGPPTALYVDTADPVFVAPPPPHEEPAMNKPRARLCKLEKSSQSEEFGFNLHAEKGRGHFIGTVDQGGIGDRAGLRMGQRIVGVNGVLVYPNTPHKEVVAQIKRSPLRTTLLVASEEVDRWYKDNGAEYSFDYVEEETSSTHNQISPHSIHISDEEEFPQLRYKAPPQSPEDTDHIEVEEVHEVEYSHKESEAHVSVTDENPPEPAAVNEPSAEEPDLMDQVFSVIRHIATTDVTAEPAEPEDLDVLEKTYELPSEDLEARPPADLVDRKETGSSSSKSSNESAVDVAEPAPHYVPTYQPQRQEPSQPAQVSPPSNGSSLNGYPTSSDSGWSFSFYAIIVFIWETHILEDINTGYYLQVLKMARRHIPSFVGPKHCFRHPCLKKTSSLIPTPRNLV
ncbi:hypothetical protein Y032_0090g2399 [Ancylostoma ceylanicum]|uniref:PDZ domain-containing protein n=1 Tax=Ancylostoma ceylanicum TaxID=53326 RepID=A0A016TN57_9BILA|nr:hypothetical protein Y032_0090g2399 [Ancylostoma ceylanicum]